MLRSMVNLGRFSLSASRHVIRIHNHPPWRPTRPIHRVYQQSFHTSRPAHVPIIPLPAVILSALKTGKLISLVSLSSKTSLTLIPHAFRRGKGGSLVTLLAGIPAAGVGLLVVVGLDQAPNTSRLRLLYLSEEEEDQANQLEAQGLRNMHAGNIVDPDNDNVKWMQSIIDNLSRAAMDDIRDPVRPLDADDDEKSRKFKLTIINDSATLNAMCTGSELFLFNLMMYVLGYDTNRLAVILSHEIAHAIQRHYVEQHGFAAFLLMLGDITRGALWMFTEALGPYINEKINQAMTLYISLETETTYNRKLEREADLVGLMILAKAGYDPTVAIDVWATMAAVDEHLAAASAEEEDDKSGANSAPADLQGYLAAMLQSWFGNTHPPSRERIEYMRENMDNAVKVYQDAIRINGAPKHFMISEEKKGLFTHSLDQSSDSFKTWISTWFSWASPILSPWRAWTAPTAAI